MNITHLGEHMKIGGSGRTWSWSCSACGRSMLGQFGTEKRAVESAESHGYLCPKSPTKNY